MTEEEEDGRGGAGTRPYVGMDADGGELARGLGCCGIVVRRGVLRPADCERVGVSTGRGRLETGPYAGVFRRRPTETRGEQRARRVPTRGTPTGV